MGIKAGIDFGTSNSGVAVMDDGQVRILPVDAKNVTPEVVKTILYITKDGQVAIGQEAVELYYEHNVNRVRRFTKKWAGEIDYHGGEINYVTDVFVFVDELKPGRLLQFIKTGLRKGRRYPGTQIFDRYYTLAEIIATYLGELKKRAENLLGEKITDVTLGRPVQFSADAEDDRLAEETLRKAAYQAGFEHVDTELEPVAAALFYEKSLTQPQNVLIYDFGGGTLDITILRLGDPRRRKIYASGGIGIAGSDFDRAIIQKRLLPYFGKGLVDLDPLVSELIDAVPDWMALPELSTPQARSQIEREVAKGNGPVQMKALESLIFNDLAFSFYNRVETTKMTLSERGADVISLQEKDLDIWELYTRSQFEKDIREYQAEIERVLLETVKASGLAPEQIDAVVKTGGSSSIPLFTSMLEKVFGAERVKVSNVFSSVTAGLAIRANEGEIGG